MRRLFAALAIALFIVSITTMVIAPDSTVPGAAPNDQGSAPPQCIAPGQQCTTYATGSAAVDLCCDGSYCRDGLCVAKENPGFFQRVWRAITGSQPSVTLPECSDQTNICYGPEGKILCDATLKECLAKYGQCRCGNPDSNAPPRSDLCPNGLLICKAPTGEEVNCRGVPEQQPCIDKYGRDACFCKQVPPSENKTVPKGEQVQPTVPGEHPNVCDPCNTVVCSYPQGGQFVCPTSLKECVAKFGDSCAVIGCYRSLCQESLNQCADPKTSERITCQGTLADCNQRYHNSCVCGVPSRNSSCQQTVHLCYVQVPGTSSSVAAAPAGTTNGWQAVKCEGRYEDCKQKYERCQCGIPSPQRCDQDVQLCYPLQYANAGDVTTATAIDSSQAGTDSSVPSISAVAPTIPVRCEGTYEECVAKYGRCTCGAPDKYCVYANTRYKIGEQFTASDGCNACTCREDGQVICTLRACRQPGTPCDAKVQTCKTTPVTMDKSTPMLVKCEGKLEECQAKYGTCTCGWIEVDQFCVYNGQMHKTGEQFTASDGCNACTCRADGSIACTQRACPPTSTCDETINRCYPQTANVGSVKCVDTYASCVAKYGRCDCGYEEPPSPRVGCTYNNTIHKDGESFPADDGCNQCSCTNGALRCTLMACRPLDCTSTANLCTTPNGAVNCYDAYGTCVQRYGECECGGAPVITKPVNVGILT